jgi:hypothetical protein
VTTEQTTTSEQERAIAGLQTRHVGCETKIRSGRHGYVEVDVWTPERVVIYEISPDGRYSRWI